MNAYEIVCRTISHGVPTELKDSDVEMLAVNNAVYVKVRNVGGKLDIPMVLGENAQKCDSSRNIIYLPLHVRLSWPVKSASTLASYMACSTQEMLKLTLNDASYNVGFGFILHEDYSPILSFNIVTERGNNRLWGLRDHPCKPYKVVLKVNANVYASDDPVSKYVRNQIIPKTLAINDQYFGVSRNHIEHIDVMICNNPDEVFELYRPQLPSSQNDLLGINNFLKQHIDFLENEES